MAPDAPAPATPEPKEPTPADVMAIAQKAAADAAEAKSIAEANKSVKDTVKEESENRGIEISDEDAQKIADTTIETLKTMGAFESETPAAPAEPAREPGGESQQTESNDPAPAPNEPPAGGGDGAPHKKTFAERFMGR